MWWGTFLEHFQTHRNAITTTKNHSHTDDKRRFTTIDRHRETTDLSTNHLINASGASILRKHYKRMAQPRIIRTRDDEMPMPRWSSSFGSEASDLFGSSSIGIGFDSSTLRSDASAIETTTRKRKVKGFRFDSTTLLGSKRRNLFSSCEYIACLLFVNI